MVTRGKFLTLEDAPETHERMRLEGLLKYVVQDDESLETWKAIISNNMVVGEYNEAGELVMFWWLTHAFAQSVFIHGCIFRAHRKHIVEIFKALKIRIAKAGGTDIFLAANRKRRDLKAFFAAVGGKYLTTINNKEIELWVVEAAAEAAAEAAV